MKRRRGAIVGFGFIAERGHLPGYRKHVDAFDIVAVADTSAERRALAERLIPGVRTYPDATSLLAAERSRLDFVDIATPPSAHAVIAKAAMNADLHVVCEKPLATTLEDADALVELARRRRRVLFPSHNYRHAPVVRAVRELLDAGTIGRVHLVNLTTFRTTHARGVAEWRPDWRRERRHAGGGIAMDHGSHTFYLAFDWLASYPTSLSARTSSFAAHDTEDTVSCHATFPTGTAVATMTWTAGVRRVSYALHGERGAILVDDDDIEVIRVVDGLRTSERSSIRSDWQDASHATWFAALFASFAQAMDSGTFVGSDAIDAVECIRVIEAAYASAAGAGVVELRRPASATLEALG